MESDSHCPAHRCTWNYVCVAPTCARRGRRLCIICVKNEHKLCPDRELLDLKSFYNSARDALRGAKETSASRLREDLRRPFISCQGNSEADPGGWKKHLGEMEARLDGKIRAGLRMFKEQVLQLQQDAVRENQEVEAMSHEKIDFIKKKCHIKVDLARRRLELKFRHSNKAQEYLVLSRFLHLFFEKRFAASRPQLMRFRKPQAPVSVEPFDASPFLEAKYLAASRCLTVAAKKNSVWRNKKGRFNQCLLVSKPVGSALFEVHVDNLSFNSPNLELLVLNQTAHAFWKKKVKLGSGEDFLDVPCLARADFDPRRRHPLAAFCRGKREIRSMEMSIRGCSRLVERVSTMCGIDAEGQRVSVWGLDTQELARFDLKAQSGPVASAPAEARGPVEVVQAGEDDDEWEDVSEESAGAEDPGQKFSAKTRSEMTSCARDQALFLALLLHNEHVKVTLRFHEFAEAQAKD